MSVDQVITGGPPTGCKRCNGYHGIKGQGIKGWSQHVHYYIVRYLIPRRAALRSASRRASDSSGPRFVLLLLCFSSPLRLRVGFASAWCFFVDSELRDLGGHHLMSSSVSRRFDGGSPHVFLLFRCGLRHRYYCIVCIARSPRISSGCGVCMHMSPFDCVPRRPHVIAFGLAIVHRRSRTAQRSNQHRRLSSAYNHILVTHAVSVHQRVQADIGLVALERGRRGRGKRKAPRLDPGCEVYSRDSAVFWFRIRVRV